jgi:cobalt-zinc-cadmium efflux system outer membrane protein
MVLVLARSAEAQELPSPLDVTTVVRLARERRQEVVARAARARARAQRPTIDGSIEQPMAMLSIDHLPFTFEGADFSVMLQQDFPLSGLLGRRRAAAEASARRALADVATATLDVAFEAVDALLMTAERRRLGDVLALQAELAREIVRAGTARFASGQGVQSDVLRAEVEVARSETRGAANAQATRGAEAMLRAALALPFTVTIPAVVLATERDLAGPDDLAGTALASRPELASMRAEQTRARAEVGVMEAMRWPMAFVRFGASSTMQEGPGVMAMFGFTLPCGVRA